MRKFRQKKIEKFKKERTNLFSFELLLWSF